MIKKYIFSFFTIIILFSTIPSTSFADDVDSTEENIDIQSEINNSSIETSSQIENLPNLNSRSCIVLERSTNSILYGKNQYNKVKMASTTKIMTSLIIIENCNLTDTVEVSKKAANTGGSRLGLKTGDKLTVNDLLYGLMLCSGNDAAVALAEHTAGSVSEFANLMNNKAKELNLNNTHFVTPHGLDEDNHFTTAYELALLSNYALQNKTFSKIVGTKNCTININGYPKNLSNTNELLGNLNGVYGIKTGFTNGANRCLVTACKRGDLDIICVVLGADTKKFRTQDSIKLIEYCFKNFQMLDLHDTIYNEFNNWKNNNNFYIDKGISNELNIELQSSNSSIIPIKNNNINNIEIVVNCTTSLYAPIYANTTLGQLDVYVDNNIVLSYDIVNSNSINKKQFYNYLIEFMINWGNYSPKFLMLGGSIDLPSTVNFEP